MGEVPSEKVLENDHALAFRDVNPGAPQHILVIPKEHIADSVADLNTADPAAVATWGSMLALVQEVTSSSAFDKGWRLVSNVGEYGQQSIFHLHLHLLGGRRFGWPPG
jgi:histidine triad (HIT) family protein